MSDATEPVVAKRYAALICVGAGLLGVLAFPPFGIWPLIVASVASFSIAVHGHRSRTGAWLGLVYGAAFFGPVLHWSGVYVGPAPWLLLAAGEAAFFAALGACLPPVQRLPFAPLWVACIWVLEEALRDRMPFGGFPWGRLAFSQADSPVRWFAALGGAPLVTFAVALAGAGLAMALLRARARRWRPALLGVAVLAAVPVVALVASVPLRPAPDRDGRTATVALIQGDVPDRGLNFDARRRQVLDNHVNQTLQLAADVRAGRVPQPELVVWPENSSDIDPFRNADAFDEIDHAVKAVGAPILVGAILDGPGPNHDRNVGILWSPTSGPGSQYVKRHPVPFGEYIPLRGVARIVTNKVDLVGRDMVAGSGTGLITGGPFPIGDVICFEVAYDDLVRSSVAHGAQLLVVQTNNATFGHTGETYQQLAMSQLRAVEHGRTVLQVATSGLSAVIGPDGQIRDRSGALFTPWRVVTSVPLRSADTLATRLGEIPEFTLAAIGLAALFWCGWRRRRSRSATDTHEITEEMVPA